MVKGFANVLTAEIGGEVLEESLAGAEEGVSGFAEGVGVAKVAHEGFVAVGEGSEVSGEKGLDVSNLVERKFAGCGLKGGL